MLQVLVRASVVAVCGLDLSVFALFVSCCFFRYFFHYYDDPVLVGLGGGAYFSRLVRRFRYFSGVDFSPFADRAFNLCVVRFE